MTLADVDEAFVGYIQHESMIGVKAMKELGLTGLPVTHIENASATGLVAFREAAWAVSSGRADVAMALCFDKFTDMGGGGGRGGGRDVIDAPILPASYFAMWAQRRMHERGTTRRALRDDRGEELELRRRVSRRRTASPITSSPPRRCWRRAWSREPLTTMMCCPADDGAACVILARDDLVRARQPGRPLVRPLASALQSETYARGHTFVGPVVGPSTMTRDTARECYEAAGLGPDDVSVAFCHDAFVNEELEYYELLGFCGEGEGEKLVAEGQTGPGGRIPFNTDGGLTARATPVGRPGSRRSTSRCSSSAARPTAARSTARASRSRISSAAAASAP